MLFVQVFAFPIIVVIPAWRIFRRAGLNPALSLFIFVPALGGLIVLLMLAFMRWPAAGPGRAGVAR
jgi:hypothetical protein